MDMKINLKRNAQLEAAPETVRTHLSDLPGLLGLFPKLDNLKDVGNNTYHWTLKPIGAAGIEHVVMYGARYTVDHNAMKVSWEPIKGVGNATLEGSIHFRETAGRIEVIAHIEGQLRDMSIPLALRLVTPAYIKKTFEALVDKFLTRLGERLGS